MNLVTAIRATVLVVVMAGALNGRAVEATR